MNIAGIGALSTALSQTETADKIQVAVLKKAMDIQAESALALVEVAAQSGRTVNPPHLGNSVDTFA